MCANCANAPGVPPRSEESIREACEFTEKEKASKAQAASKKKKAKKPAAEGQLDLLMVFLRYYDNHETFLLQFLGFSVVFRLLVAAYLRFLMSHMKD